MSKNPDDCTDNLFIKVKLTKTVNMLKIRTDIHASNSFALQTVFEVAVILKSFVWCS